MSSELKLEEFDVDGAIRETAYEASETLDGEGDTRLDFLKKAGVAGGAVMGGGALLGALVPGTAVAGKGRAPRRFGKGDVGILNFALTLEYLERDFYDEAARKNRRRNYLGKLEREFLMAVRRDEKAHVRYLQGALGNKAIKKPKFDFRDTTGSRKPFLKTAFALENTGVGAYSGQAPFIKSGEVLLDALSIVTIEGRHAGLVGGILRGDRGVAPKGPFDKPLTAIQVLKKVKATGFIQ